MKIEQQPRDTNVASVHVGSTIALVGDGFFIVATVAMQEGGHTRLDWNAGAWGFHGVSDVDGRVSVLGAWHSRNGAMRSDVMSISNLPVDETVVVTGPGHRFDATVVEQTGQTTHIKWHAFGCWIRGAVWPDGSVQVLGIDSHIAFAASVIPPLPPREIWIAVLHTGERVPIICAPEYDSAVGDVRWYSTCAIGDDECGYSGDDARQAAWAVGMFRAEVRYIEPPIASET